MLRSKSVILFALVLGLLSCKKVTFPHGQRSYEQYCATCHMEDGSGLGQMVPSLYYSKSDLKEFGEMPCMIRQGINNPDSVFQMIANPDITSVDVTNVMNYIANDFNKLDTVFTLETIELALDLCTE